MLITPLPAPGAADYAELRVTLTRACNPRLAQLGPAAPRWGAGGEPVEAPAISPLGHGLLARVYRREVAAGGRESRY